MLHISFGITAYILCVTFILGCCLGSFGDCLASRLLSGQSALSGRSRCDRCGHVLGAGDLVPLFSWLFLRGKCRYCGAKIPVEAFFTELLAGVGCCLAVYRFDLSVMSLRAILLGLVLLVISLTDIHGWVIPDRLQLSGCLIFLGTAFFLPNPPHVLLRGLLSGTALGGGMLALSLLFDRLTGKESLGGGDIKLFFMTGLYFETAWEILFYLILSCLLGLGFAALKRTQKIPFGPAIAAACFIMILYGDRMTRWYTGLF